MRNAIPRLLRITSLPVVPAATPGCRRTRAAARCRWRAPSPTCTQPPSAWGRPVGGSRARGDGVHPAPDERGAFAMDCNNGVSRD